MDRNLGALTSAAGVTSVKEYEAYKHFGLLYQWGRKEPFTGAGPQYTTPAGDVNSIPTAIFNNSGTWIQTPTETTNTHPKTNTLGGYTYSALPAKDTTTHTLLTNPTTYYKVGDGSVLPNNPNTWIPYSSTITKTIYDPCPYGYRVPINESWDYTLKNTWTQYAITGGTPWPAENGGWWPTTGYRNSGSAILFNKGYSGNCWSSSRHSAATSAYNLHFNYNNGIGPSNHNNRSSGFSVRCIEEKKISKVDFEIMLLLFLQNLSLRA